jgi:hypothetical protein
MAGQLTPPGSWSLRVSAARIATGAARRVIRAELTGPPMQRVVPWTGLREQRKSTQLGSPSRLRCFTHS